MLKYLLWFRYLRKRRMVYLSIAAIVLSVGLLIVISSVFDGFIRGVEQAARESLGDIYLSPRVQVADSGELIRRLEELAEVESACSVLSNGGLLHLGAGNVKGVSLLGIDAAEYSRVSGLKNSLLRQKASVGEPKFSTDSNSERTGGFVGIGVLGRPDEKTDEYDFETLMGWLGKDVVLTTGTVVEQADDNLYAEPKFMRRTLRFEISDIVFTGMYMRDSRDVYLPIATMRELLQIKAGRGGPSEDFLIKLADGVKAETMVGPVRAVWAEYAKQAGIGEYVIKTAYVRTMGQRLERYLIELKKQMAVLLLIFGIVCSAVVVLIFCIFYMIVMTKRKDIAVIQSCGLGSGSVAFIFVGFGGFVGLVGSVIGAGLGWVVTKNINIIEQWIRILLGLKLWKSSVYFFERIPSQIDFSAMCWIVIFAILAACVGSLIPAFVAARTRPVEILRYE